MEDIKEITLENLVDSIIKAQSIIEETEAQVKVLKDEIGDRLRAMKVTGTKVGSYFVNRVKRLSTTSVGIGQAREYGVTKETIDGEKIRQLISKGVKIVGVKWIEYINIREQLTKK
jgi:ribosome biogenesis SPOUT family RNA methylase Rps3